MPQQDPVADFLRGLNTSDRVRAAAWDAAYATDDADAQRRLQQLPFSDEVRAALWDLRSGGTLAGPVQAPQPATSEQFMNPQQQGPQGSATGRFLSNAGEMLNPVAAARGVYQAVRHPIETAGNIWDAQMEQFGKAGDAFREGRYVEGVGHAGAGALPLVGPAAANVGEQFAEGDIAGGLGATTGLVAPVAAAGALRGRIAQRRQRGDPAILERQAAQQVSQRVLAPGNVAFRGRAEAIAPEILHRGMKGGRDELAQAADEGMAQAGAQIDDAITAGGGGTSGIVVDPIVAQLRRRIESLSINGEPIKGAEGRVAGLQARIDQIERTARQARQRPGLAPAGQPVTAGPRGAMSFDDLRRIRDEQYRIADEARAYRRMGSPELSDEGFAAAETGSAIRQEFARLSPDLAAANADYTFFKTLGDVLDQAQGRPKVSAPTQGVTGGSATTGAVVGGMVSPKAAFVLGVVRPWIQRIRSEPAWQLADAQSKLRLAEAIRNGDVPAAQRLMVRIGEGTVVTATTPTESQIPNTAPAMP